MTSRLALALGLGTFAAGCAAAQQVPTTPQPEKPPLTETQLVAVAGALDQRGDVVRAEQYWTLALSQGAQAKAVLPKLMAAFVRDRQYRLALQYASEHLRKHPSDTKLRLLTGAIYEAVGDYAAAVQNYELVLGQEPRRADVHFVLAEVLRSSGADRARADLHYRKYLELAPHGPYAERAEATLLKEVAP